MRVTSILYDNNTVKNLVWHYRTKHVEIKHHFIRDYVQKGIIDIRLFQHMNT